MLLEQHKRTIFVYVIYTSYGIPIQNQTQRDYQTSGLAKGFRSGKFHIPAISPSDINNFRLVRLSSFRVQRQRIPK